MRFFFFSFVFELFFVSAVFFDCTAQNTADHLRNYSTSAFTFFDKKQYDSALYYYRKVVSGYWQRSDSALFANALNSLGVIFSVTGLLDSSLFYYTRAAQVYQAVGDTARFLECRSNLAIVYKDIGLFDEASKIAFDLVGKLEKSGPSRVLASSYNTLAVIFEKNGRYFNAVDFHKRALAIREAMGLMKGMAASLNNVGVAFNHAGQTDSALFYLEKAVALKKRVDESSIGSTFNNIGEVWMAKREPEEAKRWLGAALDQKRKINDRNGFVITLNNLAELEISGKNFPKALEYALEAERVARETRSLDGLRKTLEILQDLHKRNGNYRLAMAITDQLFEIRDSIITVENAKAISALGIRYENQKKEQQIQLLQQKNVLNEAVIEGKQLLIVSLSAGLGLAGVVAVLLYWNFRIVRKNKRKVELLHKEMHHRVKNNLQILSSVLSLQTEYLRDEGALSAVRNAEGRINSMALIHRKLYKGDATRAINMKDYLTELMQYLVASYGYETGQLHSELVIEDVEVDVDKAIPMGLILNEILNNSFKHAFSGNPSPVLSLRFWQERNAVRIDITDNGSGFDVDQDPTGHQTFGMRMIAMLIRELKGDIKIDTENGTNFKLHIPLI